MPALASIRNILACIGCTLTLTACNSISGATNALVEDSQDTPQSVAATISGNTYIPTDPLGAAYEICPSREQILDALPDNAVRIAITDTTGKASAKSPLVGGSMAGRSYRVVIDYINVDTENVLMNVAKYRQSAGGPRSYQPLFAEEAEDESFYFEALRAEFISEFLGMMKVECQRDPSMPECEGVLGRERDREAFAQDVNIPVYVGVGIRITVNLTVLKGNVNLTGLAGLAADAEAEKIAGNMIIQTLGITGSNVTSELPLPSELNQTTIQNAITSMAKIKAAMYSDDGDVIITPRIVGFYDPLGEGSQQYINAVVTQLGKEKVNWRPMCDGVLPG